MAWQTLVYQLKSDCQMIVHNGQTADPLNKWAKALKQISCKRKKTDADHEEMARIEFYAGLYIGKDGPIIPARNVDSMLVNAAKKNREGQAAKSGVFCLRDATMEYDGPRVVEDLWADERFRHVAIVRIGTARVARTRPVFSEWTAKVQVQIEDTVVNPKQIDDWFHVAGTQVGLGDWRPQHGRFSALRMNDNFNSLTREVK